MGFVLYLITDTTKFCFTFSSAKMPQRGLHWMCLEQIALICYYLLDFGNSGFFKEIYSIRSSINVVSMHIKSVEYCYYFETFSFIISQIYEM